MLPTQDLTHSKYGLRTEHLNQLIRASFDNVRGATEIAALCGSLERHSYNVSLLTSRHREKAQAFVPIAMDIIRVTTGLHRLVGRFVEENQEVIDRMVRYARSLRLVRLMATSVLATCRQEREAVKLSDSDVRRLSVDFDPVYFESVQRSELTQAPESFRAAVERLSTMNGGLNEDAVHLRKRYLQLRTTSMELGQLLGSGRYAADLGAMEAKKLFGMLGSLAHTADELCELLERAQERRKHIAERLDDVVRLLPLLKDGMS